MATAALLALGLPALLGLLSDGLDDPGAALESPALAPAWEERYGAPRGLHLASDGVQFHWRLDATAACTHLDPLDESEARLACLRARLDAVLADPAVAAHVRAGGATLGCDVGACAWDLPLLVPEAPPAPAASDAVPSPGRAPTVGPAGPAPEPVPRAGPAQRALEALGASLAPAFVAVGAALVPWPALAARLGLPAGWRRLAALAGLGASALYSRLDDEELLESPVRQAIRAVVADSPGASIQEVRGRVQVAWGTAVYHLDRLERAGLLVSHRHGNHRRYFVAGTREARERAGLAVLQAATARRLAQAVLERPGATQMDLCAEVGVRSPVASKYLQRLERHGLVRSEPRQRFRCYHPTSAMRDLAPRAFALGPAPADAAAPNDAAADGVGSAA